MELKQSHSCDRNWCETNRLHQGKLAANEAAKELVQDFISDHDIYLFGPMGVGKTTFVYELRKSYNINYVSIGEISRQKIADGDKKLEAMLGQASSWNLDIVKYLISEKIEDKTSLYLLDGVPRNISEALWLRSIAEERATGKLVVSLFADKAEIARRLSLRTDRKETAEVVNARNRYYRENYSKIIEILKPLIKTVVNIDLTAMTPAHAISKLEYEVSKLA